MSKDVIKAEDNIKIEGARIRFRNFSGKKEKYNEAGRKNFCVLLEDDIADHLIQDGWNVKYLRPRDEDEDPQAYLQVSVAFENFPPRVLMYAGDGRTPLDDESISVLDFAEIEECDIEIRPYNWVIQEGTPNEKRGVKAYLKTMHVRIFEDEFEKKWANSPLEGED